MRTETVQWIAVTTTPEDRLGNTGATEADPRDVQALVAGRSSQENADPRVPAVIVGKTLYLVEADVEPGPSDRFVVRGLDYEVDGESVRWGTSGVEVPIIRTGAQP